VRLLEILAGATLVLVGLRTAWRSVREIQPQGPGRVLMALHETARAGWWLSLGGLFLAYGLVGDTTQVRWFVMVPIAMAGLRLLSATFLRRG